MSSLSISGSGRNLFQYLQTLNSRQRSSSTASTSALSSIAAADGTNGASAGATSSVSGGHHHHHHGGGGGFFKQVQDAVTSALDSAKSSGSTTNPNQIIQDAIAKVLKHHQHLGRGAGGSSDSDGDSNSSTASGAATSSSSSSSTSSTSTSTASTGSASPAQSAFAQLLQSNGVDPAQFHQDFLTAIQSAQSGGTADASSVFTGFPTGSTVDTLA